MRAFCLIVLAALTVAAGGCGGGSAPVDKAKFGRAIDGLMNACTTGGPARDDVHNETSYVIGVVSTHGGDAYDRPEFASKSHSLTYAYAAGLVEISLHLCMPSEADRLSAAVRKAS